MIERGAFKNYIYHNKNCFYFRPLPYPKKPNHYTVVFVLLKYYDEKKFYIQPTKVKVTLEMPVCGI